VGRGRRKSGGKAIAGKVKGRQSISIGIVDDHPVFRMGLKRALERESDLKVLWELPSANNLDDQLRRHPVDLILMDLLMGRGKDGVAATKEVSEKWPRVKVIVISASVEESGVLASSRAGADGFLPKDLPVADMVASIRHLANGSVSGRGAKGDLMEAIERNPNKRLTKVGQKQVAVQDILSRRQRQVLGELRQGRTNREIAERLGISTGTVNKHVHEILTALKVRNRTQAAAAAGLDLS
jgi:two-component system response regulator DegU